MSSAESLKDRVAVFVVLVLFFLSGFAALLYQVLWQRMLALFSGTDSYSVTLTVAAFMAGLGCGSLAGGHVADRLSVRGQLRLFALSELAVGVFGLASKWVYYDALYQRGGVLASSPIALAFVLFMSLLWPTFFMGMSLPLLSKAVTRTVDRAPDRIGALYGFNTLGAAVGAFVTTWILLRSFSFETNLRWGAALNFACAVGALAVSRRLGDRSASAVKEDAASGTTPSSLRLST